jgi:hypothetical protein
MDLVDVESRTAEPGAVAFYLGAVKVADVSFMSFLSQPGVVYGDNSANRMSVLSGVDFDRVVVRLGGSGGIDNLTASNAVPEPSAALLFALGALTFGARIRRR